jgi:hypothetical protein
MSTGIRLRRKTPYDYEWRKDPDAVFVGRPTRWGNPYKASEYGLWECLRLYEDHVTRMLQGEPGWFNPLIGKNLVCYCKLDQPCHADILLKIISEYSNRVEKGSS